MAFSEGSDVIADAPFAGDGGLRLVCPSNSDSSLDAVEMRPYLDSGC
jgi:hypothetical protein